MEARSPTFARMGTMRVSPATTRATTDCDRTKLWGCSISLFLQVPDFVTTPFRNPSRFRPRMRLRQNEGHRAMGLGCGYWVGYHHRWFLNSLQNHGLAVCARPIGISDSSPTLPHRRVQGSEVHENSSRQTKENAIKRNALYRV